MMRTTGLLAFAGLAVVAMGCGSSSSNPLAGTWDTSAKTTAGATTTTTKIPADLESDGSLTLSVTVSSCTGSENISGYSWTSKGNTVTFSGTPTCTTSLTCDGVAIACTENGELKVGACTYALTEGNDTLTLSDCTNAKTDGTFTRGS